MGERNSLPIAIWDRVNSDLYQASGTVTQDMWNCYAQEEADKVNDPGIVDWSTSLAHEWKPPLSFADWLKEKLELDAPETSDEEVGRMREALTAIHKHLEGQQSAVAASLRATAEYGLSGKEKSDGEG